MDKSEKQIQFQLIYDSSQKFSVNDFPVNSIVKIH